MATLTRSEADLRVRDAVRRQLDWDAATDASGIGVTASNGTVTLTGFTDSYAGKLAAERAAKLIRGVRAVANDVEVRLRTDRSDPEIAQDVVRALELLAPMTARVQAVVRQGHVSLTGNVDWLYQKASAERAVHHVRGVKHVANHIAVVARAAAPDVKRRIVKTLHERADVDARGIAVEVTGATATLSGTVASWSEREAAERAAGDAPGVTHVDNRITVEAIDEPDEGEIC